MVFQSCDAHFNDCVYSYLATCHCVIRGFHAENCNEFWLHTEDEYLLYHTYIFNVVKECEDICIEVRTSNDY